MWLAYFLIIILMNSLPKKVSLVLFLLDSFHCIKSDSLQCNCLACSLFRHDIVLYPTFLF